MAVPKRRHSKQRSAKRRTGWKPVAAATATCSHCGQPKRPHRVCPSCGTYAEREITTPEMS